MEFRQRKTLGVIGGLGPMATAYFLQLLTQMSDAETDQEHMDIMTISKPSIPDRTKYILGISDENPVGEMVQAGRKLKEIGAEIIAIPCITAHYFHDELESKIGLPVINAVEETAVYLKNIGIEKVGIQATEGTVRSHLFQECMNQYGIECIVPKKEAQAIITSVIYDSIKAGKAVDLSTFYRVEAELSASGAQLILLACTELSLIKRDNKMPAGYLDVMEVLAKKAVESCNRLRKEYQDLVTK